MTILLTILLSLVAVNFLGAMPRVGWRVDLGHLDTNVTPRLVPLDCGDIVVSGIGSGRVLNRYSPSGDLVWSREVSNWPIVSFTLSREGGFYVVGTNSSGQLSVAKLDSSTATLWEYSYDPGEGSLDQSRGHSVCIMPNDFSCMVAGNIRHYVNDAGLYHRLVVKIDSSGSEVWRREIGSNNNDNNYGTDIAFTPGSIGTISSSLRPVQNEASGWLCKISTDGLILWQRFYGAWTGNQYFLSLCRASTSDIVAVGRNEQFQVAFGQIFLL